jgi:hypothetical protein
MIYIFTTDDPKEALQIQKAPDMVSFINYVTYTIRRRYLKHDESLTQEQYDAVEKVFEDIFECMKEYNINIDDLID